MSSPLPKLYRVNKGKRVRIDNRIGVTSSAGLFSRRWKFIWITKNLSIDWNQFHGRVLSCAAAWRSSLHAMIGGITSLQDFGVLPPNMQAFGGIIYFSDRARTGSWARKYLRFIMNKIGWNGEIFDLTPDRPIKARNFSSHWREGITDYWGGVSSQRTQRVNPYWNTYFGGYPPAYPRRTVKQQFFGLPG